MADPDLQIRGARSSRPWDKNGGGDGGGGGGGGGGRSSRPWDKDGGGGGGGGGTVSKKISFGPLFDLKIRGRPPQAPPLDSPLT